MIERALTSEQVAENASVRSKLPTERDFKGKKGYWRKYRPDGSYEWGCRFRPNADGKRTNAASEVLEMMRPHSEAATALAIRRAQSQDKAALRDKDGGIRLMAPAVADAAARRNGWHHHWRPRGNPVEQGPEGALFSWRGGEWVCLGVRCMGTPLKGSRNVPRRGIQHDPDGNPHRFIAGDWRRVG